MVGGVGRADGVVERAVQLGLALARLGRRQVALAGRPVAERRCGRRRRRRAASTVIASVSRSWVTPERTTTWRSDSPAVKRWRDTIGGRRHRVPAQERPQRGDDGAGSARVVLRRRVARSRARRARRGRGAVSGDERLGVVEQRRRRTARPTTDAAVAAASATRLATGERLARAASRNRLSTAVVDTELGRTERGRRRRPRAPCSRRSTSAREDRPRVTDAERWQPELRLGEGSVAGVGRHRGDRRTGGVRGRQRSRRDGAELVGRLLPARSTAQARKA